MKEERESLLKQRIKFSNALPSFTIQPPMKKRKLEVITPVIESASDEEDKEEEDDKKMQEEVVDKLAKVE